MLTESAYMKKVETSMMAVTIAQVGEFETTRKIMKEEEDSWPVGCNSIDLRSLPANGRTLIHV